MTRTPASVQLVDRVVAVYLAGAAGAVLIVVPALLNARSELGFPVVSYASGVPVAWHGIYFFTVLALGISSSAAYLRGARVAVAAVLGVAGLGGFEALYAVAFAVSTSQTNLLLPHGGLPAAGWMGFGTWLLIEILVASFVLVGWDRLGVDSACIGIGIVFLAGLLCWDLLLGWNYPPFDNSLSAYLVNTITEVSGCLVLPLAFTSRANERPDFLHRVGKEIFGREHGPPNSAD
jgi:hypothetical protein